MKNKNLIIMIMFTILLSTVVISESMDNIGECAGAVVVGSAAKDGRSILWKSRHMSGENNMPAFAQGEKYKYWGVTDEPVTKCVLMGENEKGLAIGNFAVLAASDNITNYDYISDAKVHEVCGIMDYILGNFSTVQEAAEYAGLHLRRGQSLLIISSEPNIGAIVTSGNNNGRIVTKVDYVTDGFVTVANGFYPTNTLDWDRNELYAKQLIEGILNNGGINNDNKVDWEEIIQKGARYVLDREKGTGNFSTSGMITRSIEVSTMVTVSGYGNQDIHMSFLSSGRTALIGTFLPLSASGMYSSSDIPQQYLSGGGIEDYYDPKMVYACGRQGSDTCNAEKVREIQNFTFSNENWMFKKYDELDFNGKDSTTTQQMLQDFTDYITPIMLLNYEQSTLVCQTHSSTICYNNNVYYADSCGVMEELKEDCTNDQICVNNSICEAIPSGGQIEVNNTVNESNNNQSNQSTPPKINNQSATANIVVMWTFTGLAVLYFATKKKRTF